jgi:ubiquinone biosynthesis accessory factor UbiJ
MNSNLEQFFADRISSAVSELLMSDDGAAARLAQLDGRVVALTARNTEFSAFLAPSARGIRLLRKFEGQVDVHVTGKISDFIAYARASKRGDSIGAGRIEISGDLSTAQSVQALLSELRIDWEEILSRYIGDVGAHQGGRFVRAAGSFGREAAERLEQDLSEYLQMEAHVLPTRRDTERLARAVFILADDVDRFEARVNRLERGGRPIK